MKRRIDSIYHYLEQGKFIYYYTTPKDAERYLSLVFRYGSKKNLNISALCLGRRFDYNTGEYCCWRAPDYSEYTGIVFFCHSFMRMLGNDKVDPGLFKRVINGKNFYVGILPSEIEGTNTEILVPFFKEMFGEHKIIIM